MSHSGEDEQGLRKIIDLTRFASIVILLLHFYYYCYRAFVYWQIKSTLTDRVMVNILHTGLFKHPYTSKFLTVSLLIISLMGAQGKKDDTISLRTIAAY